MFDLLDLIRKLLSQIIIGVRIIRWFELMGGITVHRININLCTNDGQWLNYYFNSVFCIYLLLNYMEIYQNTFKMHLLYDI